MLKIHETLTATGEASLVHLAIDSGESALEAVMARFGAPLEPSEPLIAVATLDLGGGRAVRHVRHLALYDVIARDFVVYDVPGRDSLCALAITVSAALAHLARANLAARKT
jgi:hypothetical protein